MKIGLINFSLFSVDNHQKLIKTFRIAVVKSISKAFCRKRSFFFHPLSPYLVTLTNPSQKTTTKQLSQAEEENLIHGKFILFYLILLITSLVFSLKIKRILKQWWNFHQEKQIFIQNSFPFAFASVLMIST